MPELRGFNFVGGWTLSPDTSRCWSRSSLYSAFIAEIVRSGIRPYTGAMGRRMALGLRRSFALRQSYATGASGHHSADDQPIST